MATFQREKRLIDSREFQNMFQNGTRFGSRGFTIFFQTTTRATSRLGLAVSRKVANAVGRNRIKRLTRESFRCDCELESVDLVVIARRASATMSNTQLREELNQQWKKIKQHLPELVSH